MRVKREDGEGQTEVGWMNGGDNGLGEKDLLSQGFLN